MVSRALIIERYTDLHHRIIPNGIDNLPEEYLRKHAEGENPIAWIYWHMVRTEDVGISRFVLDEEQLYDRWSKRLN
ncbi:MAG: DinB family protein, partial [Bacteroidota bacterium]